MHQTSLTCSYAWSYSQQRNLPYYPCLPHTHLPSIVGRYSDTEQPELTEHHSHSRNITRPRLKFLTNSSRSLRPGYKSCRQPTKYTRTTKPTPRQGIYTVPPRECHVEAAVMGIRYPAWRPRWSLTLNPPPHSLCVYSSRSPQRFPDKSPSLFKLCVSPGIRNSPPPARSLQGRVPLACLCTANGVGYVAGGGSLRSQSSSFQRSTTRLKQHPSLALATSSNI